MADFGRSRRTRYNYQSVKVSKDEQMPVRWMAPESLSNGIFSFASDVW